MENKTYHFVGIGGIGMSGLARILLERGRKVTGSDIKESAVTCSLLERGATIHIGHDEKHVTTECVVVVSSDIQKTNPELHAAAKHSCPVLHRSDLLCELMRGQAVLAIAGTHGKTTTTALLTHVLQTASMDPAFMVGGIMGSLETNAADGKGSYFVAEADESDGTFLKYDYHTAIVTNIDTDHLAHYGSWERLVQAFREFIGKAKSHERLFYCVDDPTMQQMDIVGIGYGMSTFAKLRATNLRHNNWSIVFDITFRGKFYKDVEVLLTGEHNCLNSLAVFGLALILGCNEADIRKGLQTFQGVKRRMEKKGQVGEVLVLDDYAHHPTEVEATLSALKKAVQERQIIALFQPHRYSRMQHCYKDFKKSFKDADRIIVTDLYSGGEKPIEGITTEAIIKEIAKHAKVPVEYIGRKELVDEVHRRVRPHDVVITMGAGDITKVGTELVELLKRVAPKKYRVGLVFGGMSCEHEVSCVSTKNFISNLNPELYDVQPLYIGLDGSFHLADSGLNPEKSVDSTPISASLLQKLYECDVFIPVLHGPFGEDGKVQGFFEVLQKPYVGGSVYSCAVSMDKVTTKIVAMHHGIYTAPFISFDRAEWQQGGPECLRQAGRLQFPLFVKPSHLGSSVGVVKVASPEALEAAIEYALQYDTHILVEQGICGRELEIAVLGNDAPQATAPGEIIAEGQVYSYDAKYKAGGFATSSRAALSLEKIEEGKKLAKTVYRALSCTGLARVDFFLDEGETFWLNEVNPMPGFTPISLYPQMWQEAGLATGHLLDRLIILALERHRLRERVFKFSCNHLK